MAIGDIFRLIDDQTLLGQDVKNVYYYRQTAGTGGADDLGVAFTLDVIPELLAAQNGNLSHEAIQVENLDDLSDWTILPFIPVESGLVSGDVLPSFVAYSIRLNRTTRETRHGYKRVAGVSESWVAGNTVNVTAGTDALDDLATAMGGPIEDAQGGEWEPVIARITTGGVVSVVNPVDGAQFVRVSTQNTRKPGSGN